MCLWHQLYIVAMRQSQSAQPPIELITIKDHSRVN